MHMNVQMKKGTLNLCVLALLNRKDCYGFELASAVSDYINIAEGTVYPLLKRLKDDKLVDSYLIESSEGPPRKYYRLTDAGKQEYQELLQQWQELTAGVLRLIEGSEKI